MNTPPPPENFSAEPKENNKNKHLQNLAIIVGILAIGLIILVNLPQTSEEEQLNIPSTNQLSEFTETTSLASDEDWTYLLSDGLNAWTPWLGSPHHSVNLPDSPPVPEGTPRPPLGDIDPINVFSLIEMEGKPTLKVSGEIPGGLISKRTYFNYHLSARYKFGDKLWPKIAIGKRDSGVLVHCYGKPGGLYKYWMNSLEYQLRDGISGTAWFHRVQGSVPAEAISYDDGSQNYRFSPFKPQLDINSFVFRPHEAKEKPGWNTMEILANGSTVIFKLNGQITFIVQYLKTNNPSLEQVLTRGHILLQSASSEIFFQDMKLRPLKTIPPEIQKVIDSFK